MCGMNVDPARAKARFEHSGKTYYFCCTGCEQKFAADPDKYLKGGMPMHAPSPKALVGIAPMGSLPEQIMPARATSQQTIPQGAVATLPSAPADQNLYICPMDPEVQQEGPGDCPKCGMALEPAVPAPPAASKTEYTCPMHPEIVRDQPGDCPICGMALEPRTVSIAEDENPELVDMTWRFWICVGLTVPVLLVAMSDLVPGLTSLLSVGSPRYWQWFEFVVTTPVVVWGGLAIPSFVAYRSLATRNLNMFTLGVGLGVSVAYAFSVVGLLFPGIFPDTFRGDDGEVAVYFEAAAAIITLVLLGQVMELRARSRTGAGDQGVAGTCAKEPRG